jgi:hypothetical protein
MRRQLFQGTYALLLLIAMLGLFRMLVLRVGNELALAGWLCLIALGVLGLLLNDQARLAAYELMGGFFVTLYQWFTSAVPVGALGVSERGALTRITWSLGAYGLLLAVVVYRWWRHGPGPVD